MTRLIANYADRFVHVTLNSIAHAFCTAIHRCLHRSLVLSCCCLLSLFELGFAAQLHEIMKLLPEGRQTALFSATMPKQLVEFSRAGLKDPRVFRLDVENKISPQLRLQFFTLRKEQKPAALLYLLREFVKPDQQTVVFTATRHHVEYLSQLLEAAGISSTPVYGQLDAAARKINIAKFRAKKASVLLVTDIAARGIDIPLLDNVVNYDFPSKPKLFVHRTGRVARAGRFGNAYSLVSSDEVRLQCNWYVCKLSSVVCPMADSLFDSVPLSCFLCSASVHVGSVLILGSQSHEHTT